MLSAMHPGSLPESVCLRDERVRVDPETSPPFKWICSLIITFGEGTGHGSGFLINIPNMSYKIVVTCAHCLYSNGAYAENVSVTFPGHAAVIAQTEDLYASPEYIQDTNPDYDYGLIILSGDSSEGFGWSAVVKDDKLLGRIITNCGYAGDKDPWPQMWITGGEITQVTSHRLFYMNDTISGQSGSPVYTWYNGYWTVLGVHRGSDCPNSSVRFTSHIIYRFLERTQNLKIFALRSAYYTDVYLRCNGDGVDSTKGGGIINCQYKPPGSYEKFFIYHVECTPSLATEQAYLVVLQNHYWQNVYVRLDGYGVTEFNPNGSGVVNCQWSGVPAHSYEVFIPKEKDGYYSFRSLAFPDYYIRLDGDGVTSRTPAGGGTVNCQYYESGSEPGLFECFFLEQQI